MKLCIMVKSDNIMRRRIPSFLVYHKCEHRILSAICTQIHDLVHFVKFIYDKAELDRSNERRPMGPLSKI